MSIDASEGASTPLSDHHLLWRCQERSGQSEHTCFGLMLRRLRQRAGMSQSELARLVGSTQSAIARLETGAAEPKLSTLSRLAEALGEDFEVHVNGRTVR